MDFVKLPKRKKFPRRVLETYKAAVLAAEAEVRRLFRKEVPQSAINAQANKARGVPKGLERLDVTAKEVEVIGIKRVTAQLMRKEWEAFDGLIDAYENYKWRLPGGVVQTGPERWHEDKYKEAMEAVCYESSSDTIAAEYTKQIASYEDYYLRCIKNMQPVFHSAWDKYTGMTYLWQDQPQVKEIYMAILTEFRDWIYAHPVDRVFLLLLASKEATLGEFFRDRPDMAAALRLAQSLPQDMERHQGDPYVSDGVRFTVELAVSLIPIAGNAVAMWEVYEGHDLFGFPLSDTERAIIAAAIFLPLAGRLAKDGVRAYTAARAFAIFGKDLQAWEKPIEWAAKAEQNHVAFKIIQDAEEEFLRATKLDIQVMKQAAGRINQLPTLAERAAQTIAPELEKDVLSQWAKVVEKYPVLKVLDLPSLRRIMAAGYSKTSISIDNMRGLIAEEMIEHWLVPLLRTRAGKAALGLKYATNKKLVFYPSHMIQSLDSSGHDIVDGLLGFWEKGEFHILAIFEGKAGETSVEAMMLPRLSPDVAKEVMEIGEVQYNFLKSQASMNGDTFTITLEEFQRSRLLAEQRRGNQLRRILQRLSVGKSSNPAELIIGGRKTVVRVLKGQNVKFHALVPNDLRPALVEQLESEMKYFHGFDFELKSIPLKMSEIKDAATTMKDVGKKVMDATRPPVTPSPPPNVKK